MDKTDCNGIVNYINQIYNSEVESSHVVPMKCERSSVSPYNAHSSFWHRSRGQRAAISLLPVHFDWQLWIRFVCILILVIAWKMTRGIWSRQWPKNCCCTDHYICADSVLFLYNFNLFLHSYSMISFSMISMILVRRTENNQILFRNRYFIGDISKISKTLRIDGYEYQAIF